VLNRPPEPKASPDPTMVSRMLIARRSSFDHFVGACGDDRRDVEAERLGGFRLRIIWYSVGACVTPLG
jgi:hypothetical protein